jgi:hypothetical protein
MARMVDFQSIDVGSFPTAATKFARVAQLDEYQNTNLADGGSSPLASSGDEGKEAEPPVCRTGESRFKFGHPRQVNMELPLRVIAYGWEDKGTVWSRYWFVCWNFPRSFPPQMWSMN